MKEPGRELIQRLMHRSKRGDAIDQRWLDDTADDLAADLELSGDDAEPLLLLDETGRTNGLTAPRWLCHLIGLRHGTVHVVLWIRQDRWEMLTQLRSRDKREFPRHLDLSATGHAGRSADWKASAYRELSEELGIGPGDLRGDLLFVAEHLQIHDAESLPYHDCEFTRIYTQVLLPHGLSSMAHNPREIEKVICFAENDLDRIPYSGWKLAPGLTHSLPIYREWLHHNRNLLFS